MILGHEKSKKMDIFIERSLRGALDFFKEAVFSEDIAMSKGFLQSIDPRIKIVLFLVLIFAASLVRSIPSLLALYLLSLVLAGLSGIRILYFIKRAWLFIPLFSLFIAIPAVFMKGLFSAAVFVLRVAASVSFAILLTITTRHGRLIRSLASLGVPQIFIQVLDMTYRYIFLFVSIFEDMHLSLRSRLVTGFDGVQSRKWIASRMSFMFKRSIKMSEEVYQAMLARGYTGDNGKYVK